MDCAECRDGALPSCSRQGRDAPSSNFLLRFAEIEHVPKRDRKPTRKFVSFNSMNKGVENSQTRVLAIKMRMGAKRANKTVAMPYCT